MSADGKTEVVTGSSRSGKTYYTTRQVSRARRVILYDPKNHPGEWPGYIRINRASTLAALLARAKRKPFKIRLGDSTLKEFSNFCEVVNAYATRPGVGPGLVVIVDELADVTSPGKAPAGWGSMIRRLKGFGVNLYAITQRPAESDKTCFGNADTLTTFYMSRNNDRKTMAIEMDIDKTRLDKLPPQLHGISRTVGKPAKTIKLPG